jgi:hypothetical protein
MPGVGYAGAVFTAIGQAIALDHRHPVEMVGEHARGEHAPDAAAHHYCMTLLDGNVLLLLH